MWLFGQFLFSRIPRKITLSHKKSGFYPFSGKRKKCERANNFFCRRPIYFFLFFLPFTLYFSRGVFEAGRPFLPAPKKLSFCLCSADGEKAARKIFFPRRTRFYLFLFPHNFSKNSSTLSFKGLSLFKGNKKFVFNFSRARCSAMLSLSFS